MYDEINFEEIAQDLADTEYLENGPEISKADGMAILTLITGLTNKQHLLIVHITKEINETFYDYVLDSAEVNTVRFEEWDDC